MAFLLLKSGGPCWVEGLWASVQGERIPFDVFGAEQKRLSRPPKRGRICRGENSKAKSAVLGGMDDAVFLLWRGIKNTPGVRKMGDFRVILQIIMRVFTTVETVISGQ